MRSTLSPCTIIAHLSLSSHIYQRLDISWASDTTPRLGWHAVLRSAGHPLRRGGTLSADTGLPIPPAPQPANPAAARVSARTLDNPRSARVPHPGPSVFWGSVLGPGRRFEGHRLVHVARDSKTSLPE